MDAIDADIIEFRIPKFATQHSGEYLRRTLGYKKNAAQKRQDKRDEQRHKRGVFRTEEMAHRERERKHAQANNRGNDRVDPYEPGFGYDDYALERENKRAYRCRVYGWREDCYWHALDLDPRDRAFDYDHVHDVHYPDDALWFPRYEDEYFKYPDETVGLFP